MHRPDLGKYTVHKPMLDNLVNVNPFLHKKSNKLNIPQKPDFIPTYEPNRKPFPPLAAQRLTTKAIPTDEQECTALPAKTSNAKRKISI